jgi:hypothetical protein
MTTAVRRRAHIDERRHLVQAEQRTERREFVVGMTDGQEMRAGLGTVCEDSLQR